MAADTHDHDVADIHTYIGREKKKKEEEEEEEKKGEDRDKNATTYSLCTKKKQGEKKIN